MVGVIVVEVVGVTVAEVGHLMTSSVQVATTTGLPLSSPNSMSGGQAKRRNLDSNRRNRRNRSSIWSNHLKYMTLYSSMMLHSSPLSYSWGRRRSSNGNRSSRRSRSCNIK